MIDFTATKEAIHETIEGYLGPSKNGKWLCPFHSEKTPSLAIIKDRYFKCFGCGQYGDAVDFVQAMENIPTVEAAKKLGGYAIDLGLPPDEIEKRKRQIEQERKEKQQAKQQAALDKLSKLSDKVDWYHSQVDKATTYWRLQGLRAETVSQYKLGFAPQCPTYRESPSYVIPYFEDGQLVNIRHRLASPNGCGKYRPEFSGLPNRLFNADRLTRPEDEIEFGLLGPGEALLVEGEVKAMYLDQRGFVVAGIPGAQSWKPDWLDYFGGIDTVFVALDPGQDERAVEIGADFVKAGKSAFLITLPTKPDDFFVIYGGGTDDFMKFIRYGRKI